MSKSACTVITYFVCVLLTEKALVVSEYLCDKHHVGDSYCLERIHGSGIYEYSTCLRNDYIQQISKGSRCRYGEDVCLHLCMWEVYKDFDSAPRGVCLCSAFDPVAPSSQMSSKCLYPDGNTCSWYTNCLEKRISCGGESGYAVAFGQKFCELYGTKKFSATGRHWVYLVRRCLQRELVPLLRPYGQATCEFIKDKAFDSHTKCYLRPDGGSGRHLICYLPKKDMMKILMTVKEAVTQETFKTISNAFRVITSCAKTLLRESYLRMFNVVIAKFRGGNRKRRRRKRSTSAEEITLASQFFQAMVDRFKWNDANIDFLLTAIHKKNDTISFKFLLSDRMAYDNVTYTGNNTQFLIEVIRVKRDIENGDVAFRIGDNDPYYVSSLSQCVDAKCNSVSHTIIGKPKFDADPIFRIGKPKFDADPILLMIGMAVLACVVVVIIAGVVVIWATSTAISVVLYKMQ